MENKYMQTQIIWLKGRHGYLDYYIVMLLTNLAHGTTEKNTMILFLAYCNNIVIYLCLN